MSLGKRYLQMAAGIALVLGSMACQSGPHSTALLPAKQASAPAIIAPPVAQAKAESRPPAPVVASPPRAETDPAADLIAQVEKEYQAGQANYQAGHLDAAKENFDRAFNLLLESPLDVGADERLQKEFDRLLDGVNGLEM